MIKILKPDFIFEDERGSLVQLVSSGYKQFNIIVSRKGSVRGGHYHTVNDESFYVINGKFKLIAYDKKNNREEFLFKKGDMFQIEKNIVHSFFFLEDSIIASMYSLGVELDNGEKDIISVD